MLAQGDSAKGGRRQQPFSPATMLTRNKLTNSPKALKLNSNHSTRCKNTTKSQQKKNESETEIGTDTRNSANQRNDPATREAAIATETTTITTTGISTTTEPAIQSTIPGLSRREIASFSVKRMLQLNLGWLGRNFRHFHCCLLLSLSLSLPLST